MTTVRWLCVPVPEREVPPYEYESPQVVGRREDLITALPYGELYPALVETDVSSESKSPRNQ
ncbi:MAG: hypothetical protein K0U72_13455 [Gammaproteobacteria bacterium]|nr:hypothetical protein [Gammaproteobacteria bacterium]